MDPYAQSYTGLLIGRRKKVKFCGIFRDKFVEKNCRFRGNFQGKFHRKTIGKKMANFAGIVWANFALKAISFALIWGTFLMKKDGNFASFLGENDEHWPMQ